MNERIQRILSILPETMLRDREAISKKLDKILQGPRTGKGLPRHIAAFERRIQASLLEKEGRLQGRPRVVYPENLPISGKRDEIIRAIQANQVLIVSGETGCGKSTQIPKMCLEAGRGIEGKIGCTQPRRIAATSIAHRIAQELGEDLGRSVGYKIRFQEKGTRGVYIKLMTDGMLLAETQGDPRLYEYDTLIIDEAHERSLNIDFLLGMLKTLLPTRPELRVVISSATLDTEKFLRTFEGAPVVTAGGRVYPVEVEYRAIDPELEETGEITYVDAALGAVDAVRAKRTPGDMLIFMPTEQDIIETCERLEGRRYPGTSILPLFARLPASEQGRIYTVSNSKIVVATNVAETSLTIPGIRYVIDTGLARIARYQPKTRTKSLPISPISRSSAEQRKGRSGRLQNGVCIRLYSEEDFASRPPFTPPEILRSNLAEVILRMIYLNLGNPLSFPFLDPPTPRAVKDGYDLLTELGAIEKDGEDYSLTGKGGVMARMPLDPRISRMMIEAAEEGCVEEVAVIASALSIQDPRERPSDKAALADQVHGPFKDPDSDFITLLNIWNRYHREWESLKTQGKMRKFCRAHFLSFSRMREWVYTHEQITAILKEQKIPFRKRGAPEAAEPLYGRIHRAVLSGFLSNIAVWKEKNLYQAARGKEVMIFPGSTLFNKKSPWIVAAEMVKTSRLFARTAARIDSAWLEVLGGTLCRSTYSEPQWVKERGEVRAFETVTLYGLPIVSRRPVSYGPVNPAEAHGIFVHSALVQGNVEEPPPFLTHNLRLSERLSAMEDKLRRRDIMAGEDVVADFYTNRLDGVYDLRSLKRLIRERGTDEFLRLKEEDLILSAPDPVELARYPDQISIGKGLLKLSYRFAPGKEDDGLTVQIPSGLASGLEAERMDWRVPAFLEEKVMALVKGLPKRYRRLLVPVPDTVELIMKEMKQGERPLLSALSQFIYRRFGVDIPASVWNGVEIPEHLKMRFALVDRRGREIRASRDPHILSQPHPLLSNEKRPAVWRRAIEKWERKGITTWDFGTLPEGVPLDAHLLAYPGLEPADEGVNLRVFKSRDQALASHVKGVRALLCRQLSKDLKFLKRSLTLSRDSLTWAVRFGGKAAFEEALYENLLKRLFEVDIRSEEAFNARAELLRATLLEEGRRLREQSEKIMDAYEQAISTLHEIERTTSSKKTARSLCALIREEMQRLVPGNFLDIYTAERLTHIPRYLKAMQIRAERGANDPEKDRKKAAQVKEFTDALAGTNQEVSAQASTEKRQALDTFRWMIEEFRVSLFAQELKTLFPISKKRLEEKKREIERMV